MIEQLEVDAVSGHRRRLKAACLPAMSEYFQVFTQGKARQGNATIKNVRKKAVGILKSLFGTSIEKSFVNDAQKVLSVCRSYGPVERGDLRVCTTMAIAFLILDSESDKDQCIFFILDAMENGRKLSNHEIGLASNYNLRLMSLQRQAYQSSSPVNNRIASGIPVWILSIRALMYVAVLPHARELWAILQKGNTSWADDELDRVVHALDGHPLGAQLVRCRHLMTPDLFDPR